MLAYNFINVQLVYHYSFLNLREMNAKFKRLPSGSVFKDQIHCAGRYEMGVLISARGPLLYNDEYYTIPPTSNTVLFY